MLDDATKRVLYAQLWPAATTHAVLTALRAVLAACGLPMALYTDELRAAGIRTLEAANAYLREQFIPGLQYAFTRPPADPASAFLPLGDVDLDQLLCQDAERTVGRGTSSCFQRARPVGAW